MNKLTLINKTNIIDNVWSFNFSPSEPVSWIAGQFIEVQLSHDNTDAEGDKRHFTISSAPYEQNIQITTRITESSFKKAMNNLEVGDSILMVEGPMGNFIWQDSVFKTVFIIGGIGITPFLSIIKQRIHDGNKVNSLLIFSNRTENIPFRAEIDDWAKADLGLSVKYETGSPLTVDRIREITPEINKSSVYLSGPEPMVIALSDQLKTNGLDGQQIKVDYFENYTENNY